MKDGRKGDGEYNPFGELSINEDKVLCDECGGELVKLETVLGEAKIRKTTSYRDMYWVNICTKCRRYVKVFELETVMGIIVGSSTKHKLRER